MDKAFIFGIVIISRSSYSWQTTLGWLFEIHLL